MNSSITVRLVEDSMRHRNWAIDLKVGVTARALEKAQIAILLSIASVRSIQLTMLPTRKTTIRSGKSITSSSPAAAECHFTDALWDRTDSMSTIHRTKVNRALGGFAVQLLAQPSVGTVRRWESKVEDDAGESLSTRERRGRD